MSGCEYRAMASDTSSRSTASVPNSRLIAASNAVECVVNGGALLPNECTINTRRGRCPSAIAAIGADADDADADAIAAISTARAHVAAVGRGRAFILANS